MRLRPILSLYVAIALFCSGFALSVPVLAASPPATPENISVLVIIMDFADAPRPAQLRYKDGVDNFVPLTVANVEDVFFDNPASTAARYSEMSSGLMTITGDVTEVTLGIDIADSTLDDWKPAADAAASALGYVTATYDRVAYLLAYGYKNQIRTGGAVGTYCWATGINSGNAYLMEYIYNHELGHTLELDHAESIEADGSILVAGDDTDPMGLGDGIHVASVNKYSKGWLDGVRNADHPLDSSATYDIYPLADTTPRLQVVLIDSHGSLPALGDPVNTLVSYRKAINFDDDLSLVATDPYGTLLRDTVHIHHTRKTGGKESFIDRALDSGDSYDSCGTLITVSSISPTRARVQIAQTPYEPVAPQVEVLPQGATAVEAGTTVYYELSVTNPDAGTGSCQAFYDQEIIEPEAGWVIGWTGVAQAISVGAGEVEVFSNFGVRAPVGTAPGLYEIGLTLTNNGGLGAPVETTVTIPYEVLISPDTDAPTAPADLVANEISGMVVVLGWTPSVDDVGVFTYLVFHNSVLLPDGGNNPGYADFPAPTGGYVQGGTNGYVVYAVDAAGNVSPPSNWAFVGDDLAPPSMPTALAVTVYEDMVLLDWAESTDNVGVASYDVYRDGMFLATTALASWSDSTVLAGGSYVYTVVASDGFGNTSAESASVVANFGPPVAEPVPSLSLLGSVALVSSLVGVAGLAQRKRVRSG